MEEKIRGISCTLYHSKNNAMKTLLQSLTGGSCKVFIPWCMVIQGDMRLPGSKRNLYPTEDEMAAIADAAIWELVLHIYPADAQEEPIETYEDFLQSRCECCLIFYDCGMLELYIRNQTLRDQLLDELEKLDARDIGLITDSNDGRIALHL